MPEYNSSYLAAERDVITWLLTQVPVPVCRELAERVRTGAHRGMAPAIDRNWEIPVTLVSDEEVPNVEERFRLYRVIEGEVRALGGYLCRDDLGKAVVVPIEIQMEDLQRSLRSVRGILSVGVALRVRTERVERGEALVHILHHGVTLCGYPTGFPKDWPSGLFEGFAQADEATCPECIRLFAQRGQDARRDQG